MRDAVFRSLKRGRQVEYRPAVLDGNDAPVRKTAAVPRTIDLVDNRCRHVPTAQEIRVQRMRDPARDRMLCGGQCLPEHLAAENLSAADITAVATEYVFLDTLQSEQRNQVIENGVHRAA